MTASHRLAYEVLIVSLLLIASRQSLAQPTTIQSVIEQVSIDSLVSTLKVLTGIEAASGQGPGDTIWTRESGTVGHELAADFLLSRFQAFGLSAVRQRFVTTYSGSGSNLLSEQTGSVFPFRKYIICAHYDDLSDSAGLAPGADDNATGCAALLEAARLLSQCRTAYTIVYALWDMEELGTEGSDYYAGLAAAHGDTILGVLNLDMLGYDADNDSLMNVHASSIAQSAQLADTVSLVNGLYALGLKMRLMNPGISSSDHAAFWRKGISAVMQSEAASGGDSSPDNHKRTDTMDKLNLNYLYRQARLATGSLAVLAGMLGPSASAPLTTCPFNFSLEQNYPNPFNPTTVIDYQLSASSFVTLKVYDILGRLVATLVQGFQSLGHHEVTFDASALASGVYFGRLEAGGFSAVRKFLLVR